MRLEAVWWAFRNRHFVGQCGVIMPAWSVQYANARLSELLDACIRGGSRLITRRGSETAVLVPIARRRQLVVATRPTLEERMPSRRRTIYPASQFPELLHPAVEGGSSRYRINRALVLGVSRSHSMGQFLLYANGMKDRFRPTSDGQGGFNEWQQCGVQQSVDWHAGVGRGRIVQ